MPLAFPQPASWPSNVDGSAERVSCRQGPFPAGCPRGWEETEVGPRCCPEHPLPLPFPGTAFLCRAGWLGDRLGCSCGQRHAGHQDTALLLRQPLASGTGGMRCPATRARWFADGDDARRFPSRPSQAHLAQAPTPGSAPPSPDGAQILCRAGPPQKGRELPQQHQGKRRDNPCPKIPGVPRARTVPMRGITSSERWASSLRPCPLPPAAGMVPWEWKAPPRRPCPANPVPRHLRSLCDLLSPWPQQALPPPGHQREGARPEQGAFLSRSNPPPRLPGVSLHVRGSGGVGKPPAGLQHPR